MTDVNAGRIFAGVPSPLVDAHARDQPAPNWTGGHIVPGPESGSSGIVHAVGRLTGVDERLRSVVDVLQEKLEPVLKEPNPVACGGPPDGAGNTCGLAAGLLDRSMSLDASVDLLFTLAERIDL